MGLRTLEISRPSEVHIKKGQLEVTNEDGVVYVPLEDLMTITCIGSNIRMSTMAQAQVSKFGISLMIIDDKYQPSCVLIPTEANARQSLFMRKQLTMDPALKNDIWIAIIKRKINNQAKCLEILGKDGYEKIFGFYEDISNENVDTREASAAKEYFYFLKPGMNRRVEDPLNSCLNYGYAVLRNAIIRSVITAGFQPSIGLHHDNYLNAFNLADDIIEPWRPFVDMIAIKDPGESEVLSREKRRELAMVLHKACLIGGKKMAVQTGIDEMILSIRNKIMDNDAAILKLPEIIPEELIEVIKE